MLVSSIIMQAGCLPLELWRFLFEQMHEAHISIKRRIPSRSKSYQLLLSINPALLPSACSLTFFPLPPFLIPHSPFDSARQQNQPSQQK